MAALGSKETEIIREMALLMRQDILRMVAQAGSGHPGGSLSAADILAVLYFHEMRIDPKNPKDPDRDRFVLSKGHASPVLYAALARRGFIPVEELSTFRRIDSRLQGHPSMKALPFVEMSTGSLGQGISAANGMAIAAKMDSRPTRVYVMIGDGELQEGEGFAPVGLAFQPGYDEEPTRSALSRCGDDVPMIPCSFHPEVTAGIFSLAGITVGMRLHSLIMSAAAGVPAFGLSYDPKVDALYEMLPLGRCVSVERLSAEGTGALEDMLRSLDSYRSRLFQTLPAVRQRAEGAAEFMLRKAEGR